MEATAVKTIKLKKWVEKLVPWPICGFLRPCQSVSALSFSDCNSHLLVQWIIISAQDPYHESTAVIAETKNPRICASFCNPPPDMAPSEGDDLVTGEVYYLRRMR